MATTPQWRNTAVNAAAVVTAGTSAQTVLVDAGTDGDAQKREAARKVEAWAQQNAKIQTPQTAVLADDVGNARVRRHRPRSPPSTGRIQLTQSSVEGSMGPTSSANVHARPRNPLLVDSALHVPPGKFDTEVKAPIERNRMNPLRSGKTNLQGPSTASAIASSRTAALASTPVASFDRSQMQGRPKGDTPFATLTRALAQPIGGTAKQHEGSEKATVAAAKPPSRPRQAFRKFAGDV